RAVALSALVSLTIVSGGFVAGLKAGKLYNTFPMMGDYWLPPGYSALEPAWRNLFENPILVQFDHRVLALLTFAAVLAFAAALARSAVRGAGGAAPPRRALTACSLLLLAAVTQVALGILTLLNHVPIVLASLHQAVAVLLLTAALYLTHALSGRIRAC
ncbi:MAG TPA: COX15/CtaA family protein, partial [Woeseiaceae bacterium]|nr:COX15/CtaA family protein [Woeseiaceae bacterium]